MASYEDAVVKVLLRHNTLVETLAMGFTEHALLLLHGLETCANESCKRAATVRHQVMGVRYCDKCAARIIVQSLRRLESGGGGDGLDTMRADLADEGLWVDLPGAIAIRRAQDLVAFSTQNLEPDMPERGSMEWQ